MSLSEHSCRPVVVGVDGSAQSLFAVRWAAAYAAHHRAPLVIGYAVEVPIEYGPGLSGPLFDGAALYAHGESVVAEAAALVAADQLVVNTFVEVGDARAVLRDRSERARLVVVGSRGLGALRRTLLGSVSTAIARHASCPVAVVPEAPVAGGAVVVGVAGSGADADAIAQGFDEASRRDVRVIAVHAWSEFFRYDSRATMRAEAEAELSASLAGYREKYPDVRVERIVVEDRPARAILTAAAGAQLIVVGSHGRGGAARTTLGSVAQAVLHGTTRPLLITRPESLR
ncbi:universal stress protein [Nocardia canadensis]|jgi:nucleotide-binding universal stress UspA family protein|uniref:universal stress protein n=1 Tax=Nocardia canadensis TaxID=3065238 RepID=UPI002930C83F|nr:universal stress protein [Nocardia canadensis]